MIASLLLFDIPLLCYYINLRSSVIFCLCSRNIYLFSSFVTLSKLFCGEVLETFVILTTFLLPIKSPVPSSVFFFFLISLLEAGLNTSLADCLS